MEEQLKIYRVLKLMTLLKCDHGRTIKSLADDLEVTTRTIYRYLDLLAMLGIDVDTKLDSNRKFIPSRNQFEDISSFTLEEAHLIKDLLLTGSIDLPMKSSILQKLYINSELETLSNELVDGRINLLKSKLAHAMNHEKQVALLRYHSLHSGEIKDYKIEPFHFSENYTSVLAYDVNAQKVKQFKLGRMSEIVVLDKNQEYADLHKIQKTDVFNFSGENVYSIRLKLSFQAYMLLREEYPKSIPYLNKNEKGEYYFVGQVYHLYGVGRFVLGMLDEIVVLEPKELKDYIKEKLEEFQNLNQNRQLPRKSGFKSPHLDSQDLATE